MKHNILYKALMIVHFFIVLSFISCNQRQTQQLNEKSDLNSHNVLYYYRNYHCFNFIKRCELEVLKIKNLDTLIYVTSSEFHGEYEEIHGKLTRINDSIYFVKTYKHLIQSGNGAMPFSVEKDTIFFYCDSSLIKSTIWIEYMNGQKEQHMIYSTENKFWINEKLFNKDKDRLYLMLDCKNPIVDENVEIASKYSEPKFFIEFASSRKLDDFYIFVNEKSIMTLNFGTENHQSLGPIFKLDRMNRNTQLPKGRKLYD